MKKLFQLFWIFFKIGAFTFGGGWAMVSLIEDQVVSRQKWMTKEEFIDVLAIIQSFPGAIAINLANFVGRHQAGTMGVIFAVLGTTLPSLIIILLIAIFYVQFSAQTWWLEFVNGLFPVILALIIKAGLGMYKKAVKDRLDLGIFISAFILIILGIHPLFIICAGGVIGYTRQKLLQRRKIEG